MLLAGDSLCKGPEVVGVGWGEYHVGKIKQHLWLDYWGEGGLVVSGES